MLFKCFAGLSVVMAAAAVFFGNWTVLGALGLFLGSFLGFVLLAVLFLCVICAPVDTNKPQVQDSKFFRTVMGVYIDALIFAVRLHVETEGLEKTPKEGRFLLVCNHQNESDPGILLHYFRSSQLAFLSKQENMDMPFVGKFMHRILCQMVNRENDREALKTILKCIQLIKDDKVSVAAFPEGGIKVKDKLSHFRSGVFKIAQKTRAPIVVCTLKGTSDLFHNFFRGKKTCVKLHLVDVIQPEEYQGITTVELGERVHAMMLDSLGEEYRLEEAQE